RQKQGRLERKATGVWSAMEHGERIATTGLCGCGKWLEMTALGKGIREVALPAGEERPPTCCPPAVVVGHSQGPLEGVTRLWQVRATTHGQVEGSAAYGKG
ncbi:hypothetical protein GW17_00054909, partial [Ensete ventricosum]